MASTAAIVFLVISSCLAFLSAARPFDPPSPSPSPLSVMGADDLADQRSGHGRELEAGQRWRGGAAETVQVAGSSLPDCSHACGSCSPCHLVMVSFVCSSLEEAETCPMAYKCMCRSKSFPVP
ncbi:protein EPIDERMAL PATTERNING FACTOR 2-like [Wolffia australiana]